MEKVTSPQTYPNPSFHINPHIIKFPHWDSRLSTGIISRHCRLAGRKRRKNPQSRSSKGFCFSKELKTGVVYRREIAFFNLRIFCKLLMNISRTTEMKLTLCDKCYYWKFGNKLLSLKYNLDLLSSYLEQQWFSVYFYQSMEILLFVSHSVPPNPHLAQGF